MKKRSFLMLTLALVGIIACNQTPPMDAKIADINTQTSRQGKDASQDLHTKLSRKWTQGDLYFNLKLDGTFEGTLQAGVVSVGKWSLSDDSKTLTLTAEKSIEGKGEAATVVYTILEATDERMKVSDAQGKILEFIGQ